MFRRSTGPVPTPIISHAEVILEQVEAARQALAEGVKSGTPQAERRRLHRALRNAYSDADIALRRVVASLATAPYPTRSYWRGRLSDLDIARQHHMFAESDDGAALTPGTVRATDTGMTYPDLHDHIHGKVYVPNSPATYGLSLPDYIDRLGSGELKSPREPLRIPSASTVEPARRPMEQSAPLPQAA